MKMIIQFFAVLALLMCALAKDYPPYADFGECETIQQWNQYSVIANCPTPDNKWQCSILDLNNCYVNFNGSITPGKGNSCNDCYWTNTVLHCNCDINPGHSFMQSQVETNDLVVNYQGFMGCYDRVADACPQGTGPAAPTLAPSAVRSSTTPAPTAALKEMKSFQA
ncbi:hypothetical protein PG988_011156 [Apiospora saccharicola]